MDLDDLVRQGLALARLNPEELTINSLISGIKDRDNVELCNEDEEILRNKLMKALQLGD